MQTIYITVQMTHDALTHIWYICDSWHNQDWLNKCRVEWPTADVHLAASVCLSVWEAVLANVGLLCQESRRAVRNLWKPLECYPWCCSSSGYTALYSSCGSFWSTWPFLINFCITFLNLHVGCACLILDVFGLMCFVLFFMNAGEVALFTSSVHQFCPEWNVNGKGLDRNKAEIGVSHRVNCNNWPLSKRSLTLKCFYFNKKLVH